MQKVTFLLISFTLGLLVIASLVTVGMLNGFIWLHIVALWLAVLLLILFFGCYMRTYRRIMTRVGVTNERVAEMKHLQERRYEQLAKRLDALKQDIRAEARGNLGSGSGSTQEVSKLSDLEHLIARAERAERRILGRLENIMLDNDKHFRTVEMKLASEGGNRKQSE